MEEKRRQLNVRLTSQQYAALERVAKENGNGTSTQARVYIAEGLKAAKKDGQQ